MALIRDNKELDGTILLVCALGILGINITLAMINPVYAATEVSERVMELLYGVIMFAAGSVYKKGDNGHVQQSNDKTLEEIMKELRKMKPGEVVITTDEAIEPQPTEQSRKPYAEREKK